MRKTITAAAAALGAIALIGFATHDRWWRSADVAVAPHASTESGSPAAVATAAPKTLRLSKPARENLNLVSRPVTVRDYWRSIQIPGIIVDRPGESDRAVTAPAVGVVREIHAFNGDTVRPGELLFTLQLISEYLQNSQSKLFQATREIQLLNEELARLQSAGQSGAVPQSRLIEARNQVRRQEAQIQAYRQDLLTRGLDATQIARVEEGDFVLTVEITAPPLRDDIADDSDFAYEVQDIKVEPGQQIEAGQLLAMLANHQRLYIEGHAFKNEAAHLAEAAAQGWEVDVEFSDDAPADWPPLGQNFQIRYLSNSIDPASRTLDFFIALTNQFRTYEKDGEMFLNWRFRPGGRVRLFIPVERFENVIVLPASAVVRDGPEAFVFRQNGDLFDRISVHVLHEDRRDVVIANDGSVTPGLFLAQNSAASLNRVLKAQAASGTPANVHVHADGTVHAPH